MSAMEEGWQILPPQPEAGQQDVEMGSPRPAAASSPLKATPPRQPKEEGSPPTSSTRDSGPPDASDEDHDDSSALFGELEELDAPEPKKAPSLDLQALAKFMHDSEPALKTSCGEDVVLLLGSTGSGKTSLVYSMSGLRLVAASHGAAGKKVYEAEKALDGFTIGHEETSETQNLRAHRLSSGTVIVDAPGQFDTRGSEVDIATSALCRQLATKCRKLRFVMLVDCGSLLHCRMGSLRQITSMIREALPDFPRNQAHRGAVCFLFTHLEKVTPYPMPSDRDEALKQARATVAELLSRALHGTDWNDDCRIVLQWMCQAIQMYNDGKLKVRLVDVYHPEWSTMEDLAAGVELFNKRGYSLGFGGESPGESVRYILTHQSKAKLNISLKHLTANFQIKLREGRTDEVRDLWQSIEMLHTYLASHPDVMSCLREMKDLLGGTHLQLQHEATCLMQRCESDAEDFDLSQVKRLQGLICQLERLPSNPIDCGLDFVHKLRMRANGCMRQHGAHVISGFCNDKLPDTRKLCRCMAKLSAWASAEPNEFEELHHQAARAQRDYLEQVAKRTSSLESLPETDVETQVWATAQLEHLSLHAEALGAESDAAEKGWATAQHMLKERLDDFRHHVKTSAGSILDGTDKELSWSGVRAAIASIDACAKRVQEDAAGAHQTARCLEAIRRSIIGDIQELLSNLRGEAEAVLPEHGDVALAAGTKVKQAYDAMSALVATLPLPERASCNRSYCERVLSDTVKSTGRMLHLAKQIAHQGGDLQKLRMLLARLDEFSWLPGEASIQSDLEEMRACVIQHCDFTHQRCLQLLATYLQLTAPQRASEQLQAVWSQLSSLHAMSDLIPGVSRSQQKIQEELSTALAKWLMSPAVRPAVMAAGGCEMPALAMNDILQVGKELGFLPGLCLEALSQAQSSVMERVKKVSADIEKRAASEDDFTEKDIMLVMLGSWHAQGLYHLLSEFPAADQLERIIEQNLAKRMQKLRAEILDPMTRASASDALSAFDGLSDVTSNAFNKAKSELIKLKELRDARTADEDKALRQHVADFDFGNVCSLLGPPPSAGEDKDNNGAFWHGLQLIEDKLVAQIGLTRQFVSDPPSFQREMRRLKDAGKHVGQLLREHKEFDLSGHISQLLQDGCQRAGDLASKLAQHLKDPIASTDYAKTLYLADQLQEILIAWAPSEILDSSLQKALEDKAAEARSSVRKVETILDRFKTALESSDAKRIPSQALARELAACKNARRKDMEEIYAAAVEQLREALSKYLHDVREAVSETGSFQHGIENLGWLHAELGHFDLFSRMKTEVAAELQRLEAQAMQEKEKLAASLCSAQGAGELPAFFNHARGDSKSKSGHPQARGAFAKKYVALKAFLQTEVRGRVKACQDSLAETDYETAGRSLETLMTLQWTMAEHLEASTLATVRSVLKDAKDMLLHTSQLRARQLRLKPKETEVDGKKILNELGDFLHMATHLSRIFDQDIRQDFELALGEFLEMQLQSLDDAVNQMSVQESVAAASSLQTLAMIMATRFQLYKDAFSMSFGDGTSGLAKLDHLQQKMGGNSLASIGKHYAILGLSLDASAEDVQRRFSSQSKIYHPDKQCAQSNSRRLGTDDATRLFQHLRTAQQVLEDESVRCKFQRGVGTRFKDQMDKLVQQVRPCTRRLLEEERYDALRQIRCDLGDIDVRTADNVGFDLKHFREGFQTVFDEEMERARRRVQLSWQQRELKDLNKEWRKIARLATLGVGVGGLGKEVRDQIELEIEQMGQKARAYVNQSEDEARRCRADLGMQLVLLGRIFNDLSDFRDQAEFQVTAALNDCESQPWGPLFLFELGMLMGQGKIGASKGGRILDEDQCICRILVNEFRHFKDVHTVMWNQLTSRTHMAVEETLKEVKTYKIMSSCKKRAQGTPTEMLKRGWEEYNTLFDDHLQQWTAGLLTPEQLAQSVIQSAQRLQPCSSDSWSENLREKVPSLLAGIFALFTIIRSGDAFMRHASASNVTAESGRESNASSAFAPKDLLIKPHSIQLLALLRLMGYGEAGSKLQNHVMQIPTGEGKSIALGGGSALLALLGFSVRCVCYSEYLSKRDWNAFRDVFIALKVDKDIVYSTVTTYSEDLILRKGDIRSLTLDLVQGQELNGGGLPTAASPSDNAAEAGKKRGIKATQPPAKKTKVNAARQRKRKMADEEQVPSACSAVVPHAATAVVSADALTPAVHAQASPAAPKEEILIVDEVDVFFGENFYGRTHNQVATLAAPEIAELFHKLWESRNERDCPQVLFQSMKGTTAFTKLLQLFPDCADVLTSELKAMCLDLKDFDFQSADYIFEDGKIGYKILDGICWNVVHGYHTAFAYLHEAGKGNIRDSDLVLDKALQLRIPCARFSYAGMKCHRILGVSGTIHHLGKHQTDIMQRYGIKSYTCMPSVYGEKRFEFLSCTGAVPIKISADKNHIFDIVTEANKVIGQGRAVLVFFKSVDHLAQFEKSPYFSTIPGKNVLRPNLPDKVKEDVIKKAATPHQATFAPAIFGRGTDFCCYDDKLEKAGGVHVIQAFFAQDRSEEIQIQGRTARQGKSGTYSLVLSSSEVEGLGLDPAELRGLTPPKLYQTLCDSRDQQQETQSAEMEERLKEASALDSRSHEYFDLLLAGRRNAAKASLSQLYRSIGCVGGASEGYHIVCCYDESGSMNGDSWTELVAAHASCMHKFAAMDHICISIVQFAEEARVVFPLGKVTDAPVDLQMVGGGPTHYTPALKKARRLMRDGTQSHAGLVPVLLFMSDGVSHDGAPVQLIQQMQNEFPEMVLHTVIFRCPDSEQLRRMAAAATEGQGHFHASADGVELMQTFSAIASGLEFTGRK